MTGPLGLLTGAAHRVRDIAVKAAGGPARARVVVILAAVLGLNGADTGTVTSTETIWSTSFISATPRIVTATAAPVVASLTGDFFRRQSAAGCTG